VLRLGKPIKWAEIGLLINGLRLKGGPWSWASFAGTGGMAACRFAWVVRKGGEDELTPFWMSLFVDVFYARLPLLLVLVMFGRLLEVRRRRR
jgi:hypothetical protein